MVWDISLKSPKKTKIFGQMSIAKLGMLLVAAFVFIELCFCGALYWQIFQAEKEARREEHFKRIVQKTHSLETLCWECTESLKQYAGSRDKRYSRLFDARSQEVLDTLAWLETELKGHKECLSCLESLTRRMQSAINTLREARAMFEASSDVAESFQQLQKSYADFTQDFRALIKNQAELVRLEERIVRDSPLEQRRLRRLIQTVLALGILANIALAFLLFRFFTSTITSRLAIMLDNTQRFKTGSKLNEEIEGADEIASLDSSFHDMARTVSEAQKMRQAFVAMISHDLRTPLTNVQAFLSLLTEGILGEISQSAKDQATKTERNVDRLIRLINDLLTLEKMEAGKMQMQPKVFYLESVIERSIDTIEDFAGQMGVKIEYEESNSEVFADPDRIIQVIVNLASNAVKFSPKGSVVKVIAQELEEAVEVQVIDQGRGVPAEHQEAIFEKYKQVKHEDGTKKGGTGLGLPICKLIIEQSGGTIGVRSEEGKGSCFWFRLPLVKDSDLSSLGSSSVPASAPASSSSGSHATASTKQSDRQL